MPPVPIRHLCLTKGYNPVDEKWSARYCSATHVELGQQEIHEHSFWIVTADDPGVIVGDEYDLHFDHAPKGSLTVA